jgi:hypothetical protein
MAKDADLAPEDVDFIIGELQHRGILKKAVLTGTRQDRIFRSSSSISGIMPSPPTSKKNSGKTTAYTGGIAGNSPGR